MSAELQTQNPAEDGKINHPTPKLLTLNIASAIEKMPDAERQNPTIKLLSDFIRKDNDNRMNAREYLGLSKQVREQAAELKKIQLPALSSGDQPKTSDILTDYYLQKMQGAEAEAQEIVTAEDNIAARARAEQAKEAFVKGYKGSDTARNFMEETFQQPAYTGIAVLVGKLSSEQQQAVFHVVRTSAEQTAKNEIHSKHEMIDATTAFLKMSKIAGPDIDTIAPALATAALQDRKSTGTNLPRSGISAEKILAAGPGRTGVGIGTPD